MYSRNSMNPSPFASYNLDGCLIKLSSYETSQDVEIDGMFLKGVLFIGPESDHWECLSVTDSLTDSLTPV